MYAHFVRRSHTEACFAASRMRDGKVHRSTESKLRFAKGAVGAVVASQPSVAFGPGSVFPPM